ncbi:MAG: glycosyltransferase family 4 protein [Planctomycetota bacterium]
MTAEPSTRPRPRVLVIAEAANPEWVSVPLVGWSMAHALSQAADTHLVTQVRNRPALLRAGLEESPDADFTAIDTEWIAGPLHRFSRLIRGGKGKGWTTATAIASLVYPFFERAVWKQFGPAIKAGQYDIVHRVTPLSPTAPSSLARKCRKAGVPFVVGPLNGGVPWPEGYGDRRRREKEWLSYIRGVYKLLPGYRSLRKHAAAILCASQATLEQMPAWCRDRCVYLPENAIDPARFGKTRNRQARANGQPLRAAFLGRLVPYKGADLLLDAAAPLIQSNQLHLEIYGEGPQRPDLEAKIAEHNLAHGVTLHGWVDHKDVQDHLRGCDILALPSVREFGGGVVLEAMALGLPAVVADYAGPTELVTPATGVAVPMGPPDTLRAGFRAALTELCDEPARVDAMGQAARARVDRLFTWAAKAQQVLRVYDWLRAGTPDKPWPDHTWPDDALLQVNPPGAPHAPDAPPRPAPTEPVAVN